jgi:uncharacterized membrane protein
LERSNSSSEEAVSQETNSAVGSQDCKTEILEPDSRDKSRDSPLQLVMWEGILPPPDYLAKYNDFVTDGAERIFKMVEIEQENRIANETADRDNISAMVNGAEKRLVIGQWTASLISVLGIGFFFALLWTERYVESAALAGFFSALAVIVKILKQDGKNIDDSESV